MTERESSYYHSSEGVLLGELPVEGMAGVAAVILSHAKGEMPKVRAQLVLADVVDEMWKGLV